MFLTISDFITKNLIGIAAFGIGIVLGILLIKLSFLILGKICKKQKSLDKKIIEPIKDPKEIIDAAVNEYYDNFSNLKIGKRISSTKDISLNLINDIAKAYYPDSKLPVGEIDIKTSIDLTREIVNSINSIVDSIIDSKTFRIFWGGYTVIEKTKNFFSNLFRRKEEKNDNTVYLKANPRKMKISDVFNQIELIRGKKNNSRENNNDDAEGNYLLFDGLINNKITDFIEYIGNKAIDVYSNNYEGGRE